MDRERKIGIRRNSAAGHLVKARQQQLGMSWQEAEDQVEEDLVRVMRTTLPETWQEKLKHLPLIWRGLPHSVARRICLEAISWTAERSLPLPKFFIPLVADAMEAEPSRSGIKDKATWWTAIKVLAANPSASTREIAAAAGTTHTTVGRWRRSGLFNRMVAAMQAAQHSQLPPR